VLSGVNDLIIDGGNLNLNGDNLNPGDGSITVKSTSFTNGTLSGSTSSLFAPSFNFNVATGNTFTVNAILADGTGGPSPLNTNTGTGTVILNKANLYTGSTNINAGTVNISSTGSIVSTNVTVASGATLNANAAAINSGLSTSTALVSSGKVFITASGGASIAQTTVASVTIHNGGAVTLSGPTTHAGRTLLTTSALALDGGPTTWQGKLDLNGNDLLVKSVGAAGLTRITSQLKQGFAGGFWNAGSGIISTVAAGDTSHLTTLGVRLGDGVTSFDGGLITPGTNDVFVKYTYYGDADLSGTINGADYALIDTTFGLENTNHVAISGWANGDFNYDGVVNGTDYAPIDNAFNQYNATSASPLAITASAAVTSAVPEPTTLGLLGIGAIGLLGRRRRSV
jgi:autotransporter-associated beta strand protein